MTSVSLRPCRRFRVFWSVWRVRLDASLPTSCLLFTIYYPRLNHELSAVHYVLIRLSVLFLSEEDSVHTDAIHTGSSADG